MAQTEINATLSAFHLAIPVTDLQQSNDFYGGLLQCKKGRSSSGWTDWNFFGHQLVTHVVAQMPSAPAFNDVDSKAVPVPHFGVVLSEKDWQSLAQRLTHHNIQFVIEPCVRFAGQIGEQSMMFFCDPFGNALEFKAFNDPNQLFAS